MLCQPQTLPSEQGLASAATSPSCASDPREATSARLLRCTRRRDGDIQRRGLVAHSMDNSSLPKKLRLHPLDHGNVDSAAFAFLGCIADG